jgi:negative regulator of sigma E activity
VAGVSIGSQRQDFELEEGWQRYRLNFSLRGDEVARLQFEFASAMSPKSLGISADQRELAARIGRIEVRPADG